MIRRRDLATIILGAAALLSTPSNAQEQKSNEGTNRLANYVLRCPMGFAEGVNFNIHLIEGSNKFEDQSSEGVQREITYRVELKTKTRVPPKNPKSSNGCFESAQQYQVRKRDKLTLKYTTEILGQRQDTSTIVYHQEIGKGLIRIGFLGPDGNIRARFKREKIKPMHVNLFEQTVDVIIGYHRN